MLLKCNPGERYNQTTPNAKASGAGSSGALVFLIERRHYNAI
jgi:hypothetical protein